MLVILSYVVVEVAVATVALFLVLAGAFRTIAIEVHAGDVENDCEDGFECRRVRRAPLVVCDRSML